MPPETMGAPPIDAMTPPGGTAPASVVPNRQGQKMAAMAACNLALKLLEEALPKLGSTSEEGQDVAAAIAKLGRRFARVEQGITQQEVKLMGETASPVGQPTPQNIKAFQQMVRSGLPGAA